MPYYSKELIAKAREMDLLTYLRRYNPGELVRISPNVVGAEYRRYQRTGLSIQGRRNALYRSGKIPAGAGASTDTGYETCSK